MAGHHLTELFFNLKYYFHYIYVGPGDIVIRLTLMGTDDA